MLRRSWLPLLWLLLQGPAPPRPPALGGAGARGACGAAAAAAAEGAAQRWEEAERRNREWRAQELRALRRHLPLRIARECSPKWGNATAALVRCAVAKALDPKATYDAKKQQEMSWAAMDYLLTLQGQAGAHAKLEQPDRRGAGSAIVDRFFTHQELMTKTAGAYPRVYILAELWDAACDDPDLGYWYSLEQWMYKFFTAASNHAVVVKAAGAADYVYLPFCIRRKLFLRTQKLELSRGIMRYLAYEGNLLEPAVRFVDEDYLLAGVRRLERESEAFAHCLARSSCRFLTTSIDGRHVYRQFSAYFQEKLVFITHMGMSNWTARQPGDLYWTDTRGLSVQTKGLLPEGERSTGCRAACGLHCQLEPPAVLREDIVMPWTVAYMWTARSGGRLARDLLGFFSGALSSCARGLLMETFRGQFVSAVLHGGRLPSEVDLTRSVLVFPPLIKLEQGEWSELAFRSRVCLVPDGDCAATGRLTEVIMHGCVPMVITNRLLPPFHDYVEWRRIAYFVREDEIPALPGILAMVALDSSGLEEKRRRLREVARFLDYTQELPAVLLVALRRRAETSRIPTEDGWGS